MNIGIIGAGFIGGALARPLARLGHRITIANSRGPGILGAVAAETGATPRTVAQAVQGQGVDKVTEHRVRATSNAD